MQNKLKNFVMWFSTPLILIKYGSATIMVALNIWLFSGIANILQGTLSLSYNETFVVTLAGSLVLLMIAGVEKGYAESGGKMTEIEAKRVRIMWIVGLGLYGLASIYALYGSYEVITNNNGSYSYNSFDWFGIVVPVTITKTLTWTSVSFTFLKALFAGGIDYIAGTLIEKDVSKFFNDDKVSANQGINDKKDMELKRKFDELYSTVEHLTINSENDYNTVNGKVGNLQSYPNQFIDNAMKVESLNKIKALKDKLKSWRDENPK